MACKYKVIIETSSSQLEREVEDYLERGYTLQGGVSVSKTSWVVHGIKFSDIIYAQAMVKNEGVQ